MKSNWDDYIGKIYIPIYTKHLGKSNRLKLFLRNNGYCLRAFLYFILMCLVVCSLTFLINFIEGK